jgi:hypothetical protein
MNDDFKSRFKTFDEVPTCILQAKLEGVNSWRLPKTELEGLSSSTEEPKPRFTDSNFEEECTFVALRYHR